MASLIRLTGLTRYQIDVVWSSASATRKRVAVGHGLGRCRYRVLVACAALRTNLTIRELAAVFAISKSQAHRVVADITRRLAALLGARPPIRDRRWSWVVDGTLIPTRDHAIGRAVQELPLVVQRAGAASTRSICTDRRHRRWRSRQSQRPGALSWLCRRDAVPPSWARAGRWRLPRCTRARDAGLPRTTNRPRCSVAPPSTTSCPCRAWHRTPQGLARPP